MNLPLAGRSGCDGTVRSAGVAEDAAPDLAPVVLERVIQVHGRGVRRGVRVAVTDGPVDGGVFLDGFGGVAAKRAVQADRPGMPEQAPASRTAVTRNWLCEAAATPFRVSGLGHWS